MTSATGELKPRLGDYLLVAKLSEDALGIVYRAIHVRDGRFARLRLLESTELPRAAVLAAIGRRDAPHRTRSFHPPGRRETLGIADGRPFLAWNETSGWTLDTILAAARKAGKPVPVEGALKIVLGAAIALEHARATVVGGEPVRHGLLWPGFITVSRNAEVWVRGFGVAPAVLSSLDKPRLSRLLASYVAPGARASGSAGEGDDVYSLGILLWELLTGRPPSHNGATEFVTDDPFSEDVARLARDAMLPDSLRFSSVAAVRERLQKLVDDCPYEQSNADLVLYLDDLLTPERASRPERPRTSASRAQLSVARRRVVDEPGASRSIWALRIAAAIAAVATLAVIDLTIHRREAPPSTAAFHPRVGRSSSAALQPPLFSAPGIAMADTLSPALPNDLPASPRPSALLRRTIRVRHEASELAEVWRLRAALSRVSAQRVDAWNLASEPFRSGRVYEKEGERLLARRKFAAAHEAFERAAQLYFEAESLSHEERARVIRVSALDDRPASSQPF